MASCRYPLCYTQVLAWLSRVQGCAVSVLAAVETVLSEAGSPLNYHEITKRILERSLWVSGGKTPEATVNANLATEIKKNGPNSRFQRMGKGLFALRESISSDRVIAPEPVTPAITLPVENSQSITSRTVSFADAAERVLEQYGNKTPMHYRAITEKALSLGLVNTAGQTPTATLYAQVLTEIARQAKRGEIPRFIKLGRGLVGLSKWIPNGVAHEIKLHNSKIYKGLHARLLSMPPVDFQDLIAHRLLPELGFAQVTVTSFSGDGGIDVRGTLVVGAVISTRMAVQVKRWTRNVQIPVVQQVRGSLGTHEQGLIITTSDFSRGARTEAQRPNAVPVALMNGEQLVTLLVAHDIGVVRVDYPLFELADPDSEWPKVVNGVNRAVRRGVPPSH
jgi:restriction system protein